MKCLTILVMLLTVFTGQAIAASELFYAESKINHRTEAVAIECLEGALGKCTSYNFQVIAKKSGEVLRTSQAMNEEAALAQLNTAIAAFDTRFHGGVLVAGTAITLTACLFGYSDYHVGFLKVGCPFIPVGLAVDIIKAPIALPIILTEYSGRKIKLALLQKRITKILRGEKAKSTKVSRREYEYMSYRF